jgi:ankyrin repeat protein
MKVGVLICAVRVPGLIRIRRSAFVLFALQIASALFPLVTDAFDEYQKQEQEFQSLLNKGEIEKAIAQLKKAPFLKDSRDDWYRRTPLHVAVLRGQIEMVKLLLDLRADVNAQDPFRFTPLHFADDPAIARLNLKQKATGKLLWSMWP